MLASVAKGKPLSNISSRTYLSQFVVLDIEYKTDLIDYNIVVLDDSLGALGEVVLNGVNHTVQELDNKERGDFSHADRHKEYVCPDKQHQIKYACRFKLHTCILRWDSDEGLQ